MFELVESKEKQFSNLAETKDYITGRKRRFCEVPLSGLTLSEEGRLRSDQFEGRLAESGFNGLLRMTRIPTDFGANVCPPDLLCANVERLSRDNDTLARVQIVGETITAVMPSDRNPINHETLLTWLGDRWPIREVVINENILRITSLTQDKELLPDDVFGFGWELINDEDGWQPTETQKYVERLLCKNGLIGFDRTLSFSRSPQSRESVADSLAKLGSVLEDMAEVEGLAEGVKWASDQQIGDEREDVVKYFSQRLNGRTTRLALDSIKADSCWYQLLNEITSSARWLQLDMRRRYESEGGRLITWYRSRGRARAPWRPVPCQDCKYVGGD